MTIETENIDNIAATTTEFPPLPSKATLSIDKAGPRLAAKTFSRTITLPIEEQRRPALGEKLVPADIAYSVMRLTGVTVDMSSSALTHTITMVVKGPDETKVLEACKMLRARLAVSVKTTARVPEKVLGVIVGKNGRTVKAIMQETGVRITIPDKRESADEDQVEVTIEGPGDACVIARQRVEEVAREAISHVVVHLDLPGYVEHFICGPGYNRRIVELQAEFGNVKLTLQQGQLALSGDVDHVNEAKETITERILKLHKEIKRITTNVPKYVHKYLVGTKGNVLRAIEESSKCLVVIPPPEEDSDVIALYGRSTDLVKGLQLLVERTAEFHEELVPCPLLIRAYLSHKHRNSMRLIEKDFEVTLKQEENGFVAVGTKERGERAGVRLKALIQSFSSLQFDTVNVKTELVRHIIGKQGHGLERLEQEYKIDVVVEETSRGHILLLVGPDQEKLGEAREATTSLITTLENEEYREVPVDEDCHVEIVRQLRSMQEKYPGYAVFLSQPNRAIRIKGPKGQVLDECQKYVMRRAQQIKQYVSEHSCTSQLQVTGEERLSLKVLRSRFKVPNDLYFDYDADKKLLTLTGTKRDVDLYTPIVRGYLSQLADQVTVCVPIEEDLIGRLIGRGGKNIQLLLDQFEPTSVKVDREGKQILISGPNATVRKLEKELESKIEGLKRTSHTKTISLPISAINRLLQRQAEELNDIQLQYKVRLSIDPFDEDRRSVRIGGEEEKIEECIERLENIALEEFEDVIDLSEPQSALISDTFNTYYRQYIAKINPAVRVFKNQANLKLRGPKHLVEEGKGLLADFLGNLGSVYSCQVVLVNQRYHGLIIGQKGSNIKKLSLAFDVAIDIGKESNEVVVTGRNVDAAIEEILKQCN